MTKIVEPLVAIMNLLPKQVLDENITYRRIIYIKIKDIEAGHLILNFLTREMILLSPEEYKQFISNTYTDVELKKLLIEKWFLIPTDFSEYKISRQIKTFLRGMALSAKMPIRQYTILPTTNCNARCFYCFELGREQSHMSAKTAEDVADFIIKKSNAAPVKINWFGGEPLCNTMAIDIICEKLRKNNIEFVSSFTSNGYLFNDKNIEKAKQLWKMRDVQITLDGTETVYNQVKSYIYKNERSPFKVVCTNIEKLLKNNFIVKIRLNMDDHNEKDLYDLVEYLYSRYSQYKKFFVYAHLLFEDSTERQLSRTITERQLMQQKFLNFNNYLKSRFPIKSRGVKYLFQFTQCQADNNGSTTVLPDGKLGKCEHFTDTDFWGSIYSNEINEDVLNDFRRIRFFEGKCNNCFLYPVCIGLLRCPQVTNHCDEFDMKEKEAFISLCMRNSYEDYIKSANASC